MENSLGISLKMKHKPTTQSSHPLLGLYPRKRKAQAKHKDLNTNIDISFICNGPKLEKLKGASISKWINRLWYSESQRSLVTVRGESLVKEGRRQKGEIIKEQKDCGKSKC